MNLENITIKYNICFCISDNKVLMLFRNNPPNQHKWNGVGGKLAVGETPEQSVIREVFEETEIQLTSNQLKYGGIVSWENDHFPDRKPGGMYAFIANLPSSVHRTDNVSTREGILAWKTLDWVINPDNSEVVDNIQEFLPILMRSKVLHHFHCYYSGEQLVRIHTTQQNP